MISLRSLSVFAMASIPEKDSVSISVQVGHFGRIDLQSSPNSSCGPKLFFGLWLMVTPPTRGPR